MKWIKSPTIYKDENVQFKQLYEFCSPIINIVRFKIKETELYEYRHN